MKRALKLAVALGLWLMFSLASLVAIVVGLVAIVFDEMPYGKNIVKAQDRLTAALLGHSGSRTLSAEMGASKCQMCRAVCSVLSLIEADHCDKAARREGA